MVIDPSFDFRTDAGGKDPDAYSPTLKQYHKLLWSKPLPSGRPFNLDDTLRGAYLHHRSDVGEYFLSSDSVIPTFTRWGFAKAHPALYSEEENQAFVAIASTIGATIVFPGNPIQRKWTINQARGCLRKISDRFDLTLECIRRHYACQSSPLGETLARYEDFFALFENFSGYVDFFLLQDLVTDDHAAVTFFMPFDDFQTSAMPSDDPTYREYRRQSIRFIEARSRRIERHANAPR
jgi:hypothetical protein